MAIRARTRAVLLALLAGVAALRPTPSRADDLRPARMVWGGYRNNDQLIGAEAKWPFTQRYMDGFLLHGAYWEHNDKDPDYAAVEAALGAALKKYGKTAVLESGFGEKWPDYRPGDRAHRDAATHAQRDIAFLKSWHTFGIDVGRVRLDWFPKNEMAVYAQYYRDADMTRLMARTTGASAFGTVPGFDPSIAPWVEYTSLLNQAYPGIEIGFDQAPCNDHAIPESPVRPATAWPRFGYGVHQPGQLMLGKSDSPASVNGEPFFVTYDTADLLEGVLRSSREHGINFYSFDADTPYNYLEMALPTFPGRALLDYLLAIERRLHSEGFHSGRFLNDTGKGYASLTHDQWDQRFHDRSLQFLETYQAAGGRADEYIAESWYPGPYTLFPETKPGTFSNLARDAIRRLRGIDDDGTPLRLEISATPLPSGRGPMQKWTLTITNRAQDRNPGDARTTPLLRAVTPGGGITFRDAAGADITDQVFARGAFDGWFVGGLNAGESRTITVEVPARTPPTTFNLYWNPQDPGKAPRGSVVFSG
jgi:hypothetical protein